MNENIKQVRQYTLYSEEFKLEVVLQFNTGKYSVPQLEKIYGVSNTSIYSWINKYSSKKKKIKEAKNNHRFNLFQKINDLEQAVLLIKSKVDRVENILVQVE
jgi:transposase